MLEQMYHLLSGYVEFKVEEGDGARLFTIAAKQGFSMWGFGRRDGCAIARMRPGPYKKLRRVCRRCKARTRIEQRRGMPFQIKRLMRRKGMILGTAAGAALYIFLSGFIWGVSVSGQEEWAGRVTQREVLDAAQEQGIYVGAAKAGIAPKVAAHGILARLNKLSWASVNTDGCFINLVVKEGTQTPKQEQVKEYSNIVALREGQVVQIEAREGRPEVELGETVKKGQLLIAGLYQEIPDPYGPQPEKLFQRAGAARGRVVAETYREFTVQVGAQAEYWRETGRSSCGFLHIFGVDIPLGIQSKTQDNQRSWQERENLRLLGVELPVGFSRRYTVEYEPRTRLLSEQEQRQNALFKLREAQRAALPEGSCIREEELEYSFAQGMCFLSAKCRCLEDIAQLQVISVQ